MCEFYLIIIRVVAPESVNMKAAVEILKARC